MKEYKLIKEFYGTQTTQRSGLLLINHIEDGLKILEAISASERAQKAYCLHPILQSDEAFNQNISMNFSGVSSDVLLLTIEYRRVANSYLSSMNPHNFVGFSCTDVRHMLVADKIQNYKDFMKYHFGKHERTNQLFQYFNNWFDLLDINYEKDWSSFSFA